LGLTEADLGFYLDWEGPIPGVVRRFLHNVPNSVEYERVSRMAFEAPERFLDCKYDRKSPSIEPNCPGRQIFLN